MRALRFEFSEEFAGSGSGSCVDEGLDLRADGCRVADMFSPSTLLQMPAFRSQKYMYCRVSGLRFYGRNSSIPS